MDSNIMFNFYKKRREAILEINSSKELISSSLSKCIMSELDNEMEKDNNLKQLLYTPAQELPERYLYLLTEVFPNVLKYTLYDLIEMSSNKSNIYSYFSKAGDKIVGWCAYHVSEDMDREDEVDEIKMFSFDLSRPNPVLLRDLHILLDNLLEKYSSVSWAAVSENPATSVYEAALKKYQNAGFETKMKNDGHTTKYKISKKSAKLD